jgi:hypothetical protein
MAAREMSEGRRSEPEGYRAEELGERVTGLHDETKWSVLTTEFWAMVLVIVAILIASAVSDTFGDRRDASGQVSHIRSAGQKAAFRPALLSSYAQRPAHFPRERHNSRHSLKAA